MRGRLRGERTNQEGALEKLAFGEPVLERLRQVCGLAASHEWDKLFRVLGPLRLSLRRIDPKLAERLTRALVGSVIKEAENRDLTGAEHLVRGFTSASEPMAIDPYWNRLWAIIWDGPQADSSGAADYWAKYIEDLKTVTILNSSESALAQAMIWNHLARLHGKVVADLTDGDGPSRFKALRRSRSGSDAMEVEPVKKRVVDCLEQSLALAPEHRPTYESLVDLYHDWDEPDKLEAAARRLLAKFPEDLDTLTLLANHYTNKNEPIAALPFVQKARMLRPLDNSLRTLEWTIRVGLARHHALAKHWDKGRDEFKAAEELLPDCRNQYFYLARKVIFEAKAGQAEHSDRYLQQAQESLTEPTPLWLALLIESIRYRMTKATQQGYARMWDADLKKKCTSETAGEMASLLDGFVRSGVDYSGRAGHIKQVLAYLERTKRIKYRRVDIERVCDFLGHLSERRDLRAKLVAIGLKQHPKSAALHFQASLVELNNGTPRATAKSRQHLEKARELAQASTDPQVCALLPDVQDALTLLNELSSRCAGRGFPAFGNGPPGFPFGADNFFDFFDDDFDDDDDDFDDDLDDDDWGPSPFSTPSGTKKPKKRQKRQKR